MIEFIVMVVCVLGGCVQIINEKISISFYKGGKETLEIKVIILNFIKDSDLLLC